MIAVCGSPPARVSWFMRDFSAMVRTVPQWEQAIVIEHRLVGVAPEKRKLCQGVSPRCRGDGTGRREGG